MLIEEEIACNLRSQSLRTGREINPKESAKLLHKLGLENKKKSPDKISLIQSVALMTSAVIRQPDNVEEIKQDLSKTCLHILTLAKASKLDTSLVDDAVTEAKQAIAVFRETTKQRLESLKPISDDLKGDELDNERKQRVEYIRKLQEDITEQYTNVMKQIASCTTAIMGKHPCKFALVGMGSIARKEITPFSDFEHIIVLDDGVQEQSLDYFRWFATVFQMILVRLGETILPFLAIPCLNDPFNSKNNWFYDAYTPCGICPDGFAPQASKNPLGRQTKTQKKPWITELIKPVSKMVKYLDNEEDLKEGYHLADMLTKTCFVYGDEEICTDFQNKVKKTVCLKPVFNEDMRSQVKEDLQLYSILTPDIGDRTGITLDLKRFVYRSSSLFVQVLGNMHNCSASSCFDIVNELFQHGIINCSLKSKLQFSLAIACEIRLRAYANRSAQQDMRVQPLHMILPSSINDLEQSIGAGAIVDCLQIAAALQVYISDCCEKQTSLSIEGYFKFEIEVAITRIPIIAAVLKFRKFAMMWIKENESLCQTEQQKNDLLISYLECMKNCGEYSACVDLIKKKLCAVKKCGLENFVKLMITRGQCLNQLKKHKQALECFREAKFYVIDEPIMELIELKTKVTVGMGMTFAWLGEIRKALQYLKPAYEQVKDGMKNSQKDAVIYYYMVCSPYATCLNTIGEFEEAESVLLELINARERITNDETDATTCEAYMSLGVTMIWLNRIEEALVYFDKGWKCKEIRDGTIKPDTRIGYFTAKTICLLFLNKKREALDFLDQSIASICMETSFDFMLQLYQLRFVIGRMQIIFTSNFSH